MYISETIHKNLLVSNIYTLYFWKLKHTGKWQCNFYRNFFSVCSKQYNELIKFAKFEVRRWNRYWVIPGTNFKNVVLWKIYFKFIEKKIILNLYLRLMQANLLSSSFHTKREIHISSVYLLKNLFVMNFLIICWLYCYVKSMFLACPMYDRFFHIFIPSGSIQNSHSISILARSVCIKASLRRCQKL